MPRAETQLNQVFYTGQNGAEFCIFVESPEAYQNFKKNPDTTPLVDVASSFQIMRSTNGKTGVLDTASKLELENEFGTTGDDAIKQILQKGKLHESKDRERQGNTNLSNGSRGVLNF